MCLSAWAIVFYTILILSLFAGLFLLGGKADGGSVLVGAFATYAIVAAAVPVVILLAGVDLWSHSGSDGKSALSASMVDQA